MSKLKYILTPLFLLGLFSSFAAAQDVVKIDDVEYVNCEHQRSVLDNLLTMLEHDPDSGGLIVIHGTDADPIFPYKQRESILTHLNFRSRSGMATADKVELVFGKNTSKLSLELWRIFDGGAKEFVSRPWDHKLPQLKQPLFVYNDRQIDAIGCGEYIPTLEFYSNFLLANDLAGRVIIKDGSYSNYKKRRKAIAEDLVRKYKVPQKNIEFAFMESQESDAEYWLMPK